MSQAVPAFLPCLFLPVLIAHEHWTSTLTTTKLLQNSSATQLPGAKVLCVLAADGRSFHPSSSLKELKAESTRRGATQRSPSGSGHGTRQELGPGHRTLDRTKP